MGRRLASVCPNAWSLPWTFCVAACLLSSCGGQDVAPKAPEPAADAEADRDFDHLYGMRATAEIGALNEDDVERTFSGALGLLEECMNEGAERIEFLGGAISFFIKIDRGGVLSHAHLESSTLGDRETEKCMLEALKTKHWPKPVGGDNGIARKSFEFEAASDVRAPASWSSSRVRSAVNGLEARIEECKGGDDGTYTATAYIGTDGSVLGVGVSPPDESGEAHVDCLVDAIRSAHFESPGSWPAKVQFKL